VAEEINQSIVMINSISEETLMAANETTNASSSLTDLANELTKEVSQFRI